MPTWDWLRTNSPVHFDLSTRMFIVTRRRDVEAILCSPDFSAALGQAERSERQHIPPTMLNSDGVDHRRLRKPGSTILNPRRLDMVTAQAQTSLAELVPGLPGRDLRSALAVPLTTKIFASLLCVSGKADLEELNQHAVATVHALNPIPDPERAAAAQQAAGELEKFLARLLSSASPASSLGRLREESEISEAERIALLSLLLVGGWSPMVDLVTSTIHAAVVSTVFDWKDADLGQAEDLVAEMLRWHTPIPFVVRRATTSQTIAGTFVPIGATVLLSLTSANRDPEAYEGPDQIRLGRGTPNLALGAGSHYCLGSIVLKRCIPTLLVELQRLAPSLSLDLPEVTFTSDLFPRQVVSPVTI